jgi:hypothetical protein
MDNHRRRCEYAAERYGLRLTDAHNLVSAAYQTGTADDLLTPAQRRRVRHKRGIYEGGSYAARRTRVSARQARRDALWSPDYARPAEASPGPPRALPETG